MGTNYIPSEIMALRDKTIQKKTDIIHNTVTILQASANKSVLLVRPKIQPNVQPKVQPRVQPRVEVRVQDNNPAVSRTRGVSYVNYINNPPNIDPGVYVTVRLTGGIGNRIFQVLAALGYSEKFEKNCVISRSNILNGAQAHEKNLDDMISKVFPHIKFVNTLQSITVINEHIGFTYTPLLKCLTNVLMHGYFQNENYFPSKHLIPSIKTSYYPNTYFIHIRAGDYLGSNEFNIDLVHYYNNCISLLDSSVKYIVFSNDNEYAKNYMNQFNIEYVLSDKTDQLDVLIEMANCAGGICANSSFSWLGAFFQGDKRGQIFMPSIWIKGKDASGVYPTWARVISTDKPAYLGFYESIRTSGNLVSFRIRNGIGNRIFQILAGLGYAEKYNKKFVLCNNLSIDGSIPHECNLNETLKRLFPNIEWVDYIKNFVDIAETNITTFTRIKYDPKNVVLHGHFQNELFFPSSNIPRIRTSYYKNTYFLHIRGGDYLDNPNLNFDLSFYYKNCLKYLGSEVQYIVFSNDNSYADNYMRQFDVKYTISDKIEQLDTLIEMANCEGGICANSTFSWMGGFFQGEERGMIFMPAVWSKDKMWDFSGIYPKWATVMPINDTNDVNIKWITIINAGYIDFTKNFLESMKKYNSFFQIIIYCLDIGIINELKNYSSAICIDASLFIDKNISGSFTKWGDSDYKQICFYKLDALRYTMKTYPNSAVGFIDTDIIVLKNPTNTVIKNMVNYPSVNIFSQCDENRNNIECSNNHKCPNFCAGICIFRNNPIVLDLLDYNTRNISKNKTDQDYLLDVANANNIKRITISKHIFLNGEYPGVNNEKILRIPSSAELIHYNWIIGKDKIKYMKKNNMWYI